MPKKGFAENTVTWERLSERLKEHAAALPHLQEQRAELEAVIQEARALKSEHLNLTAAALSAARRLRETVARGNQLESRLRLLLKGSLGGQSEKLIQFGVQPRRPRRKKKDDEETGPS